MTIRTTVLLATWTMLATPVSFAHGDGGHAAATSRGPLPAEAVDTAFGRPGDPKKAARTITVEMTDDMRFTPAELTAQRGETVRVNVVNKGRLLHEFVLGTPAELKQHSEAMRKHPGMAHDEPQTVHVQPGQRGTVVWQFTQAGTFQFGCLLPGHFEAGMVGQVVVQ